VFLLDKAILLDLSNTKVRDTANQLLRTNNFYQDDCWYKFDCDGDYVKKIQGHRFNIASETNRVTNFQSLDLANYYDLLGHIKTYTKDTWISPWFFIGSRICEEGPQRVSPDFPLINIAYTNSIWFTLLDSNQLQMNSNINFSAHVLYDGCNKPWSTPYVRKQTIQFPLLKKSVIGFANDNMWLNELFNILLSDTKRINLTEDEKYYYVYCVK
jgi:hypothetical protein